MPTLNQVVRFGRHPKTRRPSTPFLEGCPQKSGVAIQVKTTTPKKPNSAIRKVVRVMLTNKQRVTAYIPGIGHNLQEHSVVLIQGGGPADLPGVKCRVVRGNRGAEGVKNRKRNRSLYGAKKPK